ncbi:MAG: response regulator [Kofleriaceae bacterium]
MQEVINLLLVDDEPRNLDALEAILDDPGYRLIRADNADLALRELLQNDVAAIVLDIKMPGVTGFELAQLIKGTKKFRQIPIVFLTAYLLEDEDVLTGYGAGAVDYLTKPVNPQILRHKVSVFADLFRKTRALAQLNDTLEERVRERTAELEKSEAALRAAAEQKDQFLATLAHELRNPLAPLRTGLDLLMMKPESPLVEHGRVLGTMNRQLDHMVRLIDDLLDVSRISRGALELRRERSELARIIENAIEAAQPYIARKQQSIVFERHVECEADIDATRVAQVIGNLLHNASKFSADRSQIRVELALEGDRVMIRVVDPGVGIAPAQLEHVFDMFAQVRAAPAGSSGLGIGLSLARRLAQLHGGDLTASSTGENRGSTFTLMLPGVRVLRRSNGAAVGSPQPARPSRSLDILVIEDNEDAAEMLMMWLEDLGHRVKVARTGPEGLEMLQQCFPQLVLCDVGLPGMDGVEVCQRVKALSSFPQPVMVALTGWGMEADRKRTRDAGFDHHLVKPVAPDKLRDIIDIVPART